MTYAPRLKGLMKVKKTLATGKTIYYCYAWRGGPLLKAKSGEPIQPDDPTLLSVFAAAHEDRRNPQTDDLAMLIREFRRSSEFKTKSSSLQREYLRYLDDIQSKFGQLTFDELHAPSTRGEFKAWRDTMMAKPRAADYAWSTLARVLSVGKDRGLLSVNICERGGRLYRADRTEKIWTRSHVEAIEGSAPTYMCLALQMALWTGQRQGDLLRLTWAAYDGASIKLRQSKTGARVVVPVAKRLRSILDSQRDNGTILKNSRGKPWTGAGFQTSWRKACETAGICGLTFHDLRGTAVTRMALAGCSAEEIASVTGHSLRDVYEILDVHYLGNRQELARSAIAKLDAAAEPV